VTGLPGEENRSLAKDLALLTQIPDLTTQAAQLITLGGGEAVGAPAGIQVGALDPLADRGLGQVQLSGDLADRLAGGADQLDDFSLVLRRGRGIGLPSRGQGPHLGCPPSRVNSTAVQANTYHTGTYGSAMCRAAHRHGAEGHSQGCQHRSIMCPPCREDTRGWL
jgi:hypothetical protein